MKKLSMIFLSLGFVFGLLACGMSDEPSSAGQQPSQTESNSVSKDTAETPESSSENPTEGSSEMSEESDGVQSGAVVYFTSDISPEGMMAAYEALNWMPSGNVAVKLSTGEPPASNYLRPELIKDLVQSVNGTIVECNTAYGGSRAETAMHMQVAVDHGFTEIADVDILDAEDSVQEEMV